ncbi:MAG: PAS domain S-box protein [Pelovirga sp.]
MLKPSTFTNPVAPCELLVVDDQQAQLKSLQQLLHISGYPNVTLASGGDEAIRILQNSTPQLILLDLQMPDTNGLDVIAFHHQAGLESEIIVISGETSFPWVKEAMRLGAFDFICKPYKPEELLITIVKALDRFQEKKKLLEWRENTPNEKNGRPVGILAIGRDITDHKKEEEEIRRFKIMTDNAVYAKAMTDLEGKLIYVNHFFAEIHGYSPAELIGQNTSIFHSEDQLENISRRTIQLHQDGYFLPCEVWHVHRNGTEFPMLMSTVVLKDDQGNPQYLATSSIDITERKQAEEERESLRKTAEALAEVFLSLGREPQQNMDQIVRAACEVTGSAAALYNRLDDTGCSIEVWSGHQLPPDMPREDTPQGHICYEATIHGQDRTVVIGNLEGTDYERTDPAVGKYGLKAYLGHPIHRRGVAIGALAVVDIKPRSFTPGEIGAIQMLAKALSLEEERYSAEQDLRQSEERFRGILQNVDTVAVQGYALDGTTHYWNRASESFYGYTAEEALGRNLLDLIIPPAMRGEVSAAIQHMAQTGEAIPSSELALMRKDGSLIPVYSSHVLVQVAGKDIELYCIDVDLTELKRTEAAINAARRRLQATLNALPDLLFEVDSEGSIFSYHSPRSDLLPAPPEGFLDKRFADVLPQEAADVCQRAIDEAAQSGFSYGETYRLALPQGVRWFELSVAPLHVDSQSDPHFIMISRDITERKLAEIGLHDAEQKAQYQLSFHRIAAETAAALTISTSDAEFDAAMNQCLQRLGLLFGADRSYVFQFSDDLAYTTNTHEWCADGISPEIDNLQNLPMDDKSWLTTRLIRDGVLSARVADLPPEAAILKQELQRQEIQSFLIAATRGAQGELAGFIGLASVLKERSLRDDELDMIQTIAGVVGSLSVSKRSEKKLRASHKKLLAQNRLLDSLSKTDQLTGIANRRWTQQAIEQEIDRSNRYNKSFCVFLFDIDHFKTINDTHGHEVGDQVLVELVGLIQSVIRRSDILGRWGGEEFILVCPETSLRTAITIAEKICTIVREHQFTRGMGITLSIGVVEFQNGATLKETLVEVDRKMYLAKQKGRDRVEA